MGGKYRGQTSGVDLAIALLLIIAIMLAIMETWNVAAIQLGRFVELRDINSKLLDISELLVKTPGDPPDWFLMDDVGPHTVNSIGFASKENVLDAARLGKAQDLDYETLRALLGLGREDIYIGVIGLEPADKPVHYMIGHETEGSKVISSRYALLNNTLVELRISLYKGNATGIK